MLWKCLKKFLSHRQSDYYQKQILFHVLWIVWAMHESSGRKPAWVGVKSLLCRK